MITKIINPYDIVFSKNPVYFKLQITGAYILFEIYDDVKLITTLDAYPDASGYVTIDPRRILDDMVDYDMPDYQSGTITDCENVISIFLIYAKEYDSSNNIIDDQLLFPAGDWYRVVKGGISFEEYPLAGFFQTFLSTNKYFLTWNKTNILDVNQQHYLYFHNYTGADIAQVDLYVYRKFTDGTDDEGIIVSKSNFNKRNIFCFPAGVSELGLEALNPTKTIEYYIVTLKNGVLVISEEITFVVDHKYRRNTRHFLYTNSLGGVDSFRAYGEADYEYSVEKNMFMKNVPYDYQPHDGQYAEQAFTEKEEITVASGFKTATELDRFREVLLSEIVYEDINDRFLRVSIDKKSVVSWKDNDNLYNIKFKYKYNFDRRVYTPEQLDALFTASGIFSNIFEHIFL